MNGHKIISKDQKKFIQGYMCAVATLIKMEGGVNTTTYELFRCCSVEYKDLEILDEYDRGILKKHWNELNQK